MVEKLTTSVVYPANDWGAMARDPFMTIGRKDAEIRSMLKRVWTRSGGDTATFEQLIPDVGAWAQIPSEVSAKNDGLKGSTIQHIEDSVKGFTVKAAVTDIEGREATLETSDAPGVKKLVEDLENLKKQIQAEKPTGEQIKRLLAKLGKETVTLTGRSEDRNAEKAKALGDALTRLTDAGAAEKGDAKAEAAFGGTTQTDADDASAWVSQPTI